MCFWSLINTQFLYLFFNKFLFCVEFLIKKYFIFGPSYFVLVYVSKHNSYQEILLLKLCMVDYHHLCSIIWLEKPRCNLLLLCCWTEMKPFVNWSSICTVPNNLWKSMQIHIIIMSLSLWGIGFMSNLYPEGSN